MDDQCYTAAVLLERMVRDTYLDKKSSAIQPLQWSILRRLKSEHPNRPDLTNLARYLDLTLPPVSRAVVTLEKRGLIKKLPQEDKRAVAVSLTEKGFAALESDPINELAASIKQLPDSDASHFITCVRDMVVQNSVPGALK